MGCSGELGLQDTIENGNRLTGQCKPPKVKRCCHQRSLLHICEVSCRCVLRISSLKIQLPLAARLDRLHFKLGVQLLGVTELAKNNAVRPVRNGQRWVSAIST